MTKMLIDHMEGCTPFNPCTSCQAVAFLKSKLSDDDLRQLTAILYAPDAKLNESIERLNLSVRTYHALINDNIRTVGEVLSRSERDLLRIPNFGRRSLNEVREVLTQRGFTVGQLVGLSE